MEERRHLLARLARSTPKDQVPGMFIQAALGSAEARGQEVAERARRHLRGVLPLVESYRYPVASALAVLDELCLAEESLGALYGESLYRAGQEAGLAYVRSTVGKLSARMAAATGIQSTLQRIPIAASTAVTFGRHSYRQVNASTGELLFEQDLMGLAWNAGMVVASTSAALSLPPDRLHLESTLLDEDASSFLLRLHW